MKGTWHIMILTMALVAGGCNQGEKPAQADQRELAAGQAELTFERMVHDVGTLREGEQVVSYFPYRNTGEAPLIIENITSGCGCTVADWTSEPLPPGESRDLKIRFDSSGKTGVQRNRVTVLSNADNGKQVLTLKATVQPE